MILKLRANVLMRSGRKIRYLQGDNTSAYQLSPRDIADIKACFMHLDGAPKKSLRDQSRCWPESMRIVSPVMERAPMHSQRTASATSTGQTGRARGNLFLASVIRFS